jgi:tRNA-splicing ligase RtcB (3'-phosphate/5'-hydroxy nucleic acid ligase)
MKSVIAGPRPIKIWASDLEHEAEVQLRNLSTLPFIHGHIAAMPDAHAGRGSTVGTVFATHGAIVPSTIGVDIGCGMKAMRMNFKSDSLKSLSDLRHSIERAIPTGMNSNSLVTSTAKDAFDSLGRVSDFAQNEMKNFQRVMNNAAHSIGTLGGGNHFIEICVDKEDYVWIMLHSGSRNVGKCLAEMHISKAKDLMKQYFISLPDPDLAYLAQGTEEFDNYLHDLMWGQKFAKANREEMMTRVLKQVMYHVYGSTEAPNEIAKFQGFTVDCHHNYTSIEHFGGKNVYVTRKGAVSARDGEFGIIPGSMGARSFIVKGLGNPESFHSCSHGAGRKMSRTQAKRQFTVEDLAIQTAGIECRKDSDVVDEIPGAYKNIDEVMANQADLVSPVHELRQLICVKGN